MDFAHPSMSAEVGARLSQRLINYENWRYLYGKMTNLIDFLVMSENIIYMNNLSGKQLVYHLETLHISKIKYSKYSL